MYSIRKATKIARKTLHNNIFKNIWNPRLLLFSYVFPMLIYVQAARAPTQPCRTTQPFFAGLDVNIVFSFLCFVLCCSCWFGRSGGGFGAPRELLSFNCFRFLVVTRHHQVRFEQTTATTNRTTHFQNIEN